MSGRSFPGGLYAVTPDEADIARLSEQVAAAIAGGARIIQYRNKAAGAALRVVQARALATLCHRLNVVFIVNDHLDLALEVDADGLHLGGDDGDIAAARAALGPQRLLGASCYASLDLARAAVAAGADHVAFGSVFASGTKPAARAASLDLFRAARAAGIPEQIKLVGIGGITAANLPQLIAAGADSAAVIGGLFGEPADATAITRRAAALAACFSA